MVNKIKYYTLLVLLVISSCIDPFYKETPGNPRIMTVDGIITTADGPHEIRLTYANQYSRTADGNRVPAMEASVWIEDDLGQEIILEEQLFGIERRVFDGTSFEPGIVFTPTGRYKTPENFKAEIGRAYTLHITTKEGEHYESLPEKVMEVPKLDSIELGFYSVPTLNPLINNKGIQLIAHFTDPQEEQNNYYWNLSDSHFALVTEPELLPERSGGPLSCCELCFTVDFLQTSKIFSISRDIPFNGLSTRYVAARIPDNGIRFKSRYRVTLNQYAISERAYRFLRLVKQQLDIQGSVFDPPPANIRGNIVSIDQPEQQVLGYFFAADVSSQRVYINRGDIPAEYRAARAIIPNDCRFYNSFIGEEPTLAPPDDWEWN